MTDLPIQICGSCHWGSPEPSGRIFCYSDNGIHTVDDSCGSWHEAGRTDPMTGEFRPPLEGLPVRKSHE